MAHSHHDDDEPVILNAGNDPKVADAISPESLVVAE
jgi:hypothetical protein